MATSVDVEKPAQPLVSAVSWAPRTPLERHEWASAGRRLGAIGRCSQWWIGDWIRYGTAKWGERYAEAARITGYDAASLRNIAWVASRFELSLRSDKLTWSHHVLLAALPKDDQQRWLERAAAERLSVSDLRMELRTEERAQDELLPKQVAATPLVCPRCGQQLEPR